MPDRLVLVVAVELAGQLRHDSARGGVTAGRRRNSVVATAATTAATASSVARWWIPSTYSWTLSG